MIICIAQANARFSAFSPAYAAETRRTYTAHRLTFYASVGTTGARPPSRRPARPGQARQKIASQNAGEVSVTYSSGTSSSSVSTQTDLAGLTVRLLSLLKFYSITRYVP